MIFCKKYRKINSRTYQELNIGLISLMETRIKSNILYSKKSKKASLLPY